MKNREIALIFEKIADCLGSLDDLIAAEGRKLEALRQHKQGLMQQLFPQEGEIEPTLRFLEFLRSDAAQTIWHKHGFSVHAKPAKTESP